MAGKTVSAVITLIDQFSSPSQKIIQASRNAGKAAEEMSKSWEAAGQIMESTGAAMTKAVTVPLAAVGTAALAFAGETQNAMAQFAASTGTAAEEMGKYESAINNVYKQNFGESINDVANAMAKVEQNMSGLDASGVEEATKYAITLSDTLGYDVAESTRAANTMMQNFGIGAEEAYNLMAQGAQNGLDYSGEMIDSINEYSVQFAKAGMDADDMFNIMAAGAENGAFNMDKIGDAVKEFSIRAIDGSKSTAEGFAAIGLDADSMAQKFAAGGDGAKQVFDQVISGLASMKDPVAQNAAGIQLFGTMWEDLSGDVVMSLADANGAISSTKSAMDDMMSVKYDTLQSALGGLWRTIQVDVLQPLGNMLIPYVEKGINAIKNMVDWWNNLSPATQKAIFQFGLIAAAIGPVLLVGSKVVTMGTGMFQSFSRVGGALKALTSGAGGFKALAGLLTGPVGIAIAAAVAGAVLIYKNWDKISPIIQGVVNKFMAFFQRVQPQIQPFIDILQKVATFLTGVFKVAFDTVLAGLSGAIVSFFESASGVIDNILGLFEGIITFLEGVFTGNWSKIFEGLKDIVANAFGALAGIVKTPINAVISLVNSAIDHINGIQFTVPEWVPVIGGSGWKGIGIPKIPPLASGTDDWRGGLAQVHERGGEIIDLPQGTRVYPHDQSVRMAREDGIGKKITLQIAKLADQIVVREDADIDRIADALIRKLEETELNMA